MHTTVRTIGLLWLCLSGFGTVANARHIEVPNQKYDPNFWRVLIDQVEQRLHHGTDEFHWDIQGWYGGDYHRVWFKTEGDQQTSNDSESEFEIQLLYSKLIAPFWEFQSGLRWDWISESDGSDNRAFFVVGLKGLAPYFFDVEPALFISHEGDFSARVNASMDILLTQRLIAQPRFEINVAAQEVEEFAVGSGVNDIELGFRMRYEFRREFAPYIGVNWTKQFGESADFARDAGEEDSHLALIAGIRLWF